MNPNDYIDRHCKHGIAPKVLCNDCVNEQYSEAKIVDKINMFPMHPQDVMRLGASLVALDRIADALEQLTRQWQPKPTFTYADNLTESEREALRKRLQDEIYKHPNVKSTEPPDQQIKLLDEILDELHNACSHVNIAYEQAVRQGQVGLAKL